MVIVESATGQKLSVAISPVESKDFRQITKKRYSFDWKKERGVTAVFKLTLTGRSDILGLVSVIDFPKEFRLEMHLRRTSVIFGGFQVTGYSNKYLL